MRAAQFDDEVEERILDPAIGQRVRRCVAALGRRSVVRVCGGCEFGGGTLACRHHFRSFRRRRLEAWLDPARGTARRRGVPRRLRQRIADPAPHRSVDPGTRTALLPLAVDEQCQQQDASNDCQRPVQVCHRA